jgi:hypothetical protein
MHRVNLRMKMCAGPIHGDDAERQVAMCCESRLDSKNVSRQTTPNRRGRPYLGGSFYLPC